MLLLKKALAVASGFLAGWFLFVRFGWDAVPASGSWKLYECAALLGGIGLAGMFPEAWLSAATLTFNFHVSPQVMLAGVAFSLLIGAAGGLLPATRGARLEIITALRAR